MTYSSDISFHVHRTLAKEFLFMIDEVKGGIDKWNNWHLAGDGNSKCSLFEWQKRCL